MKALMTAACLATVCALAADAQGQGQGQGQQQGQTQQTTPQQKADPQSVTLSGCLERDTAAAAATGAQAGQATQPAFKLTDVTILTGAANIGRTATGQQQQQREEDKDKEFRLQASAGVDLNQHVGHEVEVVGRVAGAPSMTTPRAGTTGGTGTGTATGQQQQQQQQRAGQQDDKAPLVVVSAIKMTATTCR